MDWTQSVPLRRRGKARKTNRAHQGEDEHHTMGRPGTGWFPPADVGPRVTTAESDKSTDTQSDTYVYWQAGEMDTQVDGCVGRDR